MKHKKFLKRLLYFALMLIIINVILDQLYKNFVVHNILNNAKDKDFMAYDDTLKYLSLGNSHNTVNTHILDNAYNYNAPAENYVQSYYKLKSIIKEKKKKPEYLLLYIDMSAFSQLAAGYFEHNSYWIKYIDYFELSRIMHDKRILSKWLEGKFVSYAGGYRDIMLSIVYLVKIGKLDLHNGFRPPRNFKNFAYKKPADISLFSDEADYDWTKGERIGKEEKIIRAKAKSGIYFNKKTYFDKTMATYFKMILQLCQENDIKVILLRAPLTKAYWEDVNTIIPVDSLYAKVESIYRQYPNVTNVLDYHNIFFNHPEYFFDADHINPKGTEIFTKRLKKDLKKEDKKNKTTQTSER